MGKSKKKYMFAKIWSLLLPKRGGAIFLKLLQTNDQDWIGPGFGHGRPYPTGREAPGGGEGGVEHGALLHGRGVGPLQLLGFCGTMQTPTLP